MLNDEIEAVLKQLESCWNAMDLNAIKDLWDAEETQPFYLPEESEKLLSSWEDIENYWQQTRTSISRMSMRTWDVTAKLLQPDLAVTVYRMHWNGEVTGYPAPLGGENRVTAILRRREEHWRFCHYVEAPLAPILYLRRLYELDTDAEFLNAGKG